MNDKDNIEIKTWPYSGIFFFFWLASNILVPYLALFYEGKGFDSEEIGWLAAMFQFIAVIAALAGGYIVDQSGKPGLAIILMTIGMIGSSLILYFSWSFTITMSAVILLSFCYAPVNGITDKVIMAKLKSNPAKYSQARAKGTLGAALGIIIAAVLIKEDYYFPIIIGFIVTVLPCLFYAMQFEKEEKSQGSLPRLEDYRALLKSKYFIPLYVSLAVWGLSESGVGTFQALIIKNAGYPVTLTSLLVAFAMIGEYIGFFSVSKLQQRFPLAHILAGAFALQALRIGSLALIGILPLPVVIILQFTGGASFAIVYSMVTLLVNRLFPGKVLYTAHSLKRVMSSGIGNTLGLLFSGFMFGRQLGRLAYLIMASGAAAFILYFIMNKDIFDT